MPRPRGVPNKPRTLLDRELAKMGIKPLDHIQAALSDEKVSKLDKAKIVLKLMTFQYPTLKSTEIKGDGTGALKVSFVDDNMTDAWEQKPPETGNDAGPNSQD